jgi:hypothetical protein
MRAHEFIKAKRRRETDEDYDPNSTPPGPEFKPTMPAGTVRVDVSDVYDWYKLGQHISNLKGLGKHDFGAGPPSTIFSFGSEPEEHKYIKDLEKTGLTTTDIDPLDPHQPKGMKRQKTDPTFNVNEKAQRVREGITKTNQKVKNLIENRFPQLPDEKVYFERGAYSKEWTKFKKHLIEYQLQYDDGTQFGKLKMRKIAKFIAESYHGVEDTGLHTLKNTVKKLFEHSIKPRDLEIGKKYDVAVVYLDKLSKIVEINAHHDQAIKNVQFSKSLSDYVVSTDQGLQGTTTLNQVEEIETLCFERNDKLDGLLTFLTLKVQSELDGWKLSIISDKDSASNVNDTVGDLK